MIELHHVPNGLKAINLRYGNPDQNQDFVLDEGWLHEWTQLFSLPRPLVTYGGRTATRIRAHRDVGPAIIDALEELADVDMKWGGCWWFRKMYSLPYLSTHSWGISCDINWETAKYGADPSTQDERIVKAFELRGFEWGGRWRTPDPMHFQACTGY